MKAELALGVKRSDPCGSLQPGAQSESAFLFLHDLIAGDSLISLASSMQAQLDLCTKGGQYGHTYLRQMGWSIPGNCLRQGVPLSLPVLALVPIR